MRSFGLIRERNGVRGDDPFLAMIQTTFNLLEHLDAT